MDEFLTGSAFGQVRAFVVVSEALSFSRAAERLGVSPSAVSQTVRAFEERVGLRLLNRTTRNVSLTDAGETLFRRLAPAVGELGAAVSQASRGRGRPAGIVRIHAFRAAGDLFLAPMLARFAATYPEVTLDITLDDAVVELVGGRYDVAIRIGEVIERDMIAVPLGPELRQIAVASPDYLASHGAPATPADLVAHRCIRWRWPGQSAPYNWEFWQNGAWFEVAVDGPLIVNSKEMNVAAAVAGVGIGFVVESTATQALAAGRLVRLLEAWSAPFPGYHICYPQQRAMAPALRAFIDEVRSEASRARRRTEPKTAG